MTSILAKPSEYVQSKPLKFVYNNTPRVVNKVIDMTKKDITQQYNTLYNEWCKSYNKQYETIHKTKQQPFNTHYNERPVHAVVSHGFVIGNILYDNISPHVVQMYNNMIAKQQAQQQNNIDSNSNNSNSNNTATQLQPVVVDSNGQPHAIGNQQLEQDVQRQHQQQQHLQHIATQQQEQKINNKNNKKNKKNIFSCLVCGNSEHD